MRLALAAFARPDPRHGKGRGYNRDDYALWLGQAALLVRATWRPRPKLSPGPVHLEVTFVVAPPKKEAAKLAGLFCARRPDLDRFAHSVMDAITQAGNVWDDDSQVARLSCAKRYAHIGEPIGIELEVSSLPLSGPTHAPELDPTVRQCGAYR